MKPNLANRVVFFLICASIVVSTLFYGTVHQSTISMFYITVTAMVIAWAVDSLRSGQLRVSTSYLQIPLYATAIYAFVQIIPFGDIADVAGLSGIPRTISLSPFDTGQTGLHILALSFYFSILLIYIDSTRRLRTLVNVIAIFGFTFSFFAILQSLLSPTRIYGIYERPNPFGSFINRHNFAAFTEMTLCIPLGLLFTGAVPRDKRLLYITGAILIGMSLILSGSRGGLVALLAELIALTMLSMRLHGAKKLAVRVALVVVLFGAIIVGAIFVGGETSLSRFAETATSKDITTDRTHIWSVTLQVAASNLPLGAGLGAFAQAYTLKDDFNGLERVEQAHNDYLQVVADAGLIGAVIGIAFLFLLVRNAGRAVTVRNMFRRGIAIGAASGIFAVLVHSIFDFVLHTTAISLLFLVLIAMLAASRRDYPDDEHEHAPRRHRRSSSKVSAFENR